MPRKIRELKADLLAIGFVEVKKRGKGSHRVWKHPQLPNVITIAYRDGEDVPPYLEQQLRKARNRLNLEP